MLGTSCAGQVSLSAAGFAINQDIHFVKFCFVIKSHIISSFPLYHLRGLRVKYIFVSRLDTGSKRAVIVHVVPSQLSLAELFILTDFYSSTGTYSVVGASSLEDLFSPPWDVETTMSFQIPSVVNMFLYSLVDLDHSISLSFGTISSA